MTLLIYRPLRSALAAVVVSGEPETLLHQSPTSTFPPFASSQYFAVVELMNQDFHCSVSKWFVTNQLQQPAFSSSARSWSS